MPSFITLLGAATLFMVSANALSITPHNGVVARSSNNHHRDISVPDTLAERGGSKKVCLAWAGNAAGNIKHFKTSHTKHLYTWSPYCPPEAKEHGLDCCPMFWGKKDEKEWWKNAYKGAKCAMGMNEVNVPSQGYLSVSEGLKLWYEYLCPLKKQGFYVVSPSVTSGADGVKWLKQFYKEVSHECRPNALAFHYYGKSASQFESYAKQFHDIAHTDVWVTEIACQNFGNPKEGQCSKSEISSFMGQTIKFMEETSWITDFCFFGLFWDMYNVNPLNRLVTDKGLPNTLGDKFINAKY